MPVNFQIGSWGHCTFKTLDCHSEWRGILYIVCRIWYCHIIALGGVSVIWILLILWMKTSISSKRQNGYCNAFRALLPLSPRYPLCSSLAASDNRSGPHLFQKLVPVNDWCVEYCPFCVFDPQPLTIVLVSTKTLAIINDVDEMMRFNFSR